MMRCALFPLLFVFSLSAFSQPFQPIPQVVAPLLFNSQLQYTAALLNEQQPQVRVLVYGQSISVQDWWKEVAVFFEKKYPNATFNFVNKAIVGFSAERLKFTAENDIASFYPDLILFHDYGNEQDYEKIIRIIRSKTTADIAVQTDHMANQDQVWHDRHSKVWLPELCKKYGLALIDIRTYWKKYLQKNNLEIKELLVDGVHLNHHGNYLMAETIKAYFNNLRYDGVSGKRITKLQKGKDFHVKNGLITMTIIGNRVDIRSDSAPNGSYIDLLVNQRSLKDQQGCYYYTRPLLKSTGDFLTRIGSLIAIKLSDRTREENWSLTVLSVDSLNQEITYSLMGSRTGKDGKGTSRNRFISNSGRIMIDQDAWFFRKNEGDFAQYGWIKPGEVLQWKTKSMCHTRIGLTRGENQTLFQGISNTPHQLTISGAGVDHIDEILVYSPILKEEP
jgi:hypothetical protein